MILSNDKNSPAVQYFENNNYQVSIVICLEELYSEGSKNTHSTNNNLILTTLVKSIYKEREIQFNEELLNFLASFERIFTENFLNDTNEFGNSIYNKNKYDNVCDIRIVSNIYDNKFFIVDDFTGGKILPKTTSTDDLRSSISAYFKNLRIT